jgi:hypothetical protein
MSFRFLIRGTSVSMLAGAIAFLFPAVRTEPGWALIGWLLPVAAILLPGAWLIGHRGENPARWMAVWVMTLLIRMGLLAAGAIAAVRQGPPVRDAFLSAMALGFAAAIGYETIALLRSATADDKVGA